MIFWIFSKDWGYGAMKYRRIADRFLGITESLSILLRPYKDDFGEIPVSSVKTAPFAGFLR